MVYSKSNRRCFNLSYHVILTVKYRKKILSQFDIVSALSFSQKRFTISYIGLDQDHVHLIIKASPTISISTIIKDLKQFSTYWLWSKYEPKLKRIFYSKKVFWNSAYFASTLGDISRRQVEEYLETQCFGRCIPLPNGTAT